MNYLFLKFKKQQRILSNIIYNYFIFNYIHINIVKHNYSYVYNNLCFINIIMYYCITILKLYLFIIQTYMLYNNTFNIYLKSSDLNFNDFFLQKQFNTPDN